MLNTLVYNPPVYKASQWALHNATYVATAGFKGLQSVGANGILS